MNFSLSHGGEKPKDCELDYSQVKGSVMQTVNKYDKLFSNTNGKNNFDFEKLEAFKNQYGLPINVSVPKSPKNFYKDRLEVDGIDGGVNALIFLKNTHLIPGSGFTLDEVFEVASPKVSKSIKRWDIPYNEGVPDGIQGDEIFIRTHLSPICNPQNIEIEILLAVKTDGTFSILDPKLLHLPPETSLDDNACPAAKKIMRNSDYGICRQMTDMSSKKNRFLIFNGPMT